MAFLGGVERLQTQRHSDPWRRASKHVNLPMMQTTTSAEQLKVNAFDDSMRAEWDEYVLQHGSATFFHLTTWKKIVERSFGFESRYLVARDADGICGVLPLFLTSNWVQGRTLISTPFAVYGGILASSEEGQRALCSAACSMAAEEKAEYLELREPHHDLGDGFRTKQLYVTFKRELPSDPAELLRQLPKDTRYMIRKGQKAGLRSVTGNEQLQSFYDIYAISVRHLGTPVFSKRFFEIQMEELGTSAETTVIWHGSKAVAAVLSFRFRDEILPYYGGSLPEARSLAANNFMYWELLRSSCERGIRTFDFGRSKLGTGAYTFKTQWNMHERPLPYQFHLAKRKSMPNFSPVNPRFKVATNIWKHIPVSVTRAIGPTLVRMFP